MTEETETKAKAGAIIVPVTPFEQNCTILWDEATRQAAVIDPGGDVPRILAAIEKTGVKVETSWEQNITAADSLVVPKGTKNKDAAMQFIAFATSAQAQADMAATTGYAPINLGSAKLMDAETVKTLPDQQKASQVNADMTYWAANRDAIGERWYAWQAK